MANKKHIRETEFYSGIEQGIKAMVRLLRDNGFNTTCSCEHDMDVELDLIGLEDAERLWKLLFNEGHRNFHIVATVQIPPDGFPVIRATLTLNDWLMGDCNGK